MSMYSPPGWESLATIPESDCPQTSENGSYFLFSPWRSALLWESETRTLRIGKFVANHSLICYPNLGLSLAPNTLSARQRLMLGKTH